MKDLERETGTPRTTIHYYLREGLLPPPEKTAKNAARYSEEHRRRIDVIRELRSGPYPAPIGVVRRALELIDNGVAPETAVALERAVIASTTEVDEAGSFDKAGLARRAGVPKTLIEAMIRAGVLVALPGQELPFDGLDRVVVERLSELCRLSGMKPSRLAPIAKTLRQVVQLEMELRDDLVRDMTLADAADVSRAGQLFVNVWHSYLTSRARLQEIRKRGLGAAETAQRGERKK